MHVCFICGEYPRPGRAHGGIGRKLQLLAERLVAEGHRATVVGIEESEQSIEQRGVQIHAIRRVKAPAGMSFLINRLRLRSKLRELIKKEAIDIIEHQDNNAPLAPVQLPIPRVVRYSCSHTYFARVLGHRPNLIRYWLERRSIRRAAGHAACSSFVGAFSAGIFGVQPSRVVTLYNPVDLTEFPEPSPEQIIPGRVVFVGSIYWVKGVYELFEAFERLHARQPHATLVMVGKDRPDTRNDNASTSKRLVASLSLTARSRVVFLGHEDRAGVCRELAKAEVFVLPSKNEGHSNAVSEAQAAGKAVVLGDRASAREVVEHGVSGLLVDPEDPDDIANKIEMILTNGELRDCLSGGARSVVEDKFSLDVLMPQNVRFYQDTVDRWLRAKS